MKESLIGTLSWGCAKVAYAYMGFTEVPRFEKACKHGLGN